MKAVVWHGVGDIRLDEVPDPKILEPSDAIIRLTRSAICGTDLHLVRGTIAPAWCPAPCSATRRSEWSKKPDRRCAASRRVGQYLARHRIAR